MLSLNNNFIMKAINILKRLINIYYYLLVLVIIVGILTIPLLILKKKYIVKFLGEEVDLNTLSSLNMVIVLILVATLWFLYFKAIKLLKHSVHELSEGHYFSKLAIGNFKTIGILFLICGLGEIFAKIILNLILKNSFRLGIDSSVVTFLIMGLFFMFLSEVFLKGSQLEEENELTI